MSSEATKPKKRVVGVPFNPATAKLAGKIGRASRWGVKPAGALVTQGMADIESRQTTGLQRESQIVRGELAALVRHCVSLITLQPPRRKRDLGNTPDGEGIVSVLGRLSDTASTIFGWEAQSGNVLVLVGLAERYDPELQQQPALDVEASPSPADTPSPSV